jgi:predicted metal-dependent phosphoesterase TrpH
MILQRCDLHLHTRVSDGQNDLETMLAAAAEAGLRQVSITDHDAVGAYRHFHPKPVRLAREMGLELIPGIELDTDYLGREVHLLGYRIDIDNPDLCAHLTLTQGRRREKVILQIEAVNAHFGRMIIDPETVLLPERDTLMKPHLVHGLLKTGQWGHDYRAAQAWLGEHIRVMVEVPKLPIARAIEMIHGAGGQAVLAHPGFLSMEQGLELSPLLRELKSQGLDGLEVEYAYIGSSKAFASPESEAAIITELRGLAQQFNLFTTRGSDAHEPQKIKDFAKRLFD